MVLVLVLYVSRSIQEIGFEVCQETREQCPQMLCLDIHFCFAGEERSYWLDKPAGKMQQVFFEDFALPFIGLLSVFFCLFFYGNRFQILSCFLEKHSRGGWMSWAETWVSFASFHFQLVYNIPIFVIEPSLPFFFCTHDTTGKLLNSLNINLLLQRKKSKKISCFFYFFIFF